MLRVVGILQRVLQRLFPFPCRQLPSGGWREFRGIFIVRRMESKGWERTRLAKSLLGCLRVGTNETCQISLGVLHLLNTTCRPLMRGRVRTLGVGCLSAVDQHDFVLAKRSRSQPIEVQYQSSFRITNACQPHIARSNCATKSSIETEY